MVRSALLASLAVVTWKQGGDLRPHAVLCGDILVHLAAIGPALRPEGDLFGHAFPLAEAVLPRNEISDASPSNVLGSPLALAYVPCKLPDIQQP